MNRSVTRVALAVFATAALLVGMTGVGSAATSRIRSTGPLVSTAAVALDDGSPPEGWYYIRNRWTGRCLDAHFSHGGGNGNPVGLWDCNGGVTERWYIAKNHRTDEWNRSIMNLRVPFRYLDYPRNEAGLQFRLWDKRPPFSFGQEFDFDWAGDGVGGREIMTGWGGRLVMDAYTSFGGGNGNPVGLWPRTNHPAQRWDLVPVPPSG